MIPPPKGAARRRSTRAKPGDPDYLADPDFAAKNPGAVCQGACGAPNRALCVCDDVYDRVCRSMLAYERIHGRAAPQGGRRAPDWDQNRGPKNG